MKTILRDKKVNWRHFLIGVYLSLIGIVISFFNPVGYVVIAQGFIPYCLAEILLGGDDK